MRFLTTIRCLAGAVIWMIALPWAAQAQGCAKPLDVCTEHAEERFPLISGGAPVRILADEEDWPGVLRAAGNLEQDLEKLSQGSAPEEGGIAILAGTIGRSVLIDKMIADGKLDVSEIEGVWEGYVQAVVDAPTEGISRALVIAGSDKRGTIFGIYDLSRQAGVSPWHWWADVPVPHRPDLSLVPGSRAEWPRVKYRGIFINDEKPALHGWANHTYGGFNSAFYERVFELILRNKGNYLWPAMWGEAIYDDDPLTGPLADEMGIVLGTSHHEPMGRAHVEWARYGQGKWDYSTNAAYLRDFWREGMSRMKDWESVVTVGMRGDGDEAMTEGTAISLLERIVTDQRALIEEVTGRPAPEQPAIWALYKEVQDYFDQGMQVPEDITLLFADDNWGNIRRLPDAGAAREGGYGVYYHFDYVGGPRNYKWLNTNQIERTWEQMNLAWEFGARQMWIVNVGDIKPMELPISFFLDQAWNPQAMTIEEMERYPEAWASQQFPKEYAAEIADILKLYTKYSSRRKHELVDPDTFSVVNYSEFRRVTAELESLAERADTVRAQLPPEYEDAYVQLVWFPVQAVCNLYRLYEAVALNRLYAEQGRAAYALEQAALAEEYYARDAELTRIYHEDVADGKWVHMMSQTHIGYTYWQQPDAQVMPAIERPEVPEGRGLGVAIEGDSRSWRMGNHGAALPQSDIFNQQVRWIDLFKTGSDPVKAALKARQDWILLPESRVTVDGTRRISIAIDWAKVPPGRHTGEVLVKTGFWSSMKISVPVFKPEGWETLRGFAAAPGYVSMDAASASRKIDGHDLNWQIIPNLGRTGDGLTLFPPTNEPARPGEQDAPRLEFDVHFFEAGDMTVEVELAPTLDFKGQGGMRYAVSIDDGPPVMVNINEGTAVGDWNEQIWEALVARNAHQHRTEFRGIQPGKHVIKVWAVDAPLVFQKVTASQWPVPVSYLGPPVSKPR